MKIEADVLVQEIPIRFLPEAGQGLKSWLTNSNRELMSIEEVSTQIQKGGAGSHVWMSPSAGDDLCRILLTYRGVLNRVMEINVPKKYESQVDFDKFIIE